jgi:aquaporin NIP
MRKYIAEFIGTFFLVFAGTGAIVVNQEMGETIGHVGIALTFGMVVMAMIYAVGETSGAHLNPAVSIAFWFAKKFSTKDLIGYIVVHVLAALAASALMKFSFPESEFLGATIPAGSLLQSAIFEFIMTFILMYVILNVSTGAKETGVMAGTAIGATVGLEAMFGGPVSGASMNPARSIGPAILSGHTEHLWMYVLVTIFGAVLAVYVCKLTKGPECCTVC